MPGITAFAIAVAESHRGNCNVATLGGRLGSPSVTFFLSSQSPLQLKKAASEEAAFSQNKNAYVTDAGALPLKIFNSYAWPPLVVLPGITATSIGTRRVAPSTD